MKLSFEKCSYSLSSRIHFFFSSAKLTGSFIIKDGTEGRFFLIGLSFIISFNAIFPNNLPGNDCLYFVLPNAISSHLVQCFIICETFILPHSALLSSFSELILFIISSLVFFSYIDFFFLFFFFF